MNEKTNYMKINAYYEDNFKKIMNRLDAALQRREDNFKLLGWESRAAQYRRFAVFAENVKLDNLSLLDVGTGLGDLYHFLTQGLHLSIDYTGTDILQKMIDLAKLQAEQIALPEGVNARCAFFKTDVFAENQNENILQGRTFDVIYSSGIFNLNLGNNIEFLSSSFLKFASMAEKCFACSLLSETSTDKESEYFYYSKQNINDALKKVLNVFPDSSYKIVTGYLQNDMTIIWQKTK